MKKYKIYTALLPLFLMLALVGCSSSDDDYQAAEPLQSDNQQVHFSGENSETTLLDPTDPTSYTINLKVARNTTKGALTVPVEVEKETSAGVSVPDSVVFADGNSTATLAVSIPDTATTSGDYTAIHSNLSATRRIRILTSEEASHSQAPQLFLQQ